MKVYILDSNYDKLGYIDEADSILWTKKYNDVGECEIYTQANITMFEWLRKGNYIYRSDDDMLCKIESVEVETDVENGDYITATAKDMKSILANRIVRWEVTYSGLVCDFIKKVIDESIINPMQSKRAIKNFKFNDDNFSEFTETIEAQAFTEDLLQLVINTCKTYNYGFKVKYLIDTKTLEFSLYKGKNKASITSETYVEFSPTYANIISSNYKEDESNYKNLCYVKYKGNDEADHLLSITNLDVEPEGEARKEVYVDGTSISKEMTWEELKTIYPDAYFNSDNKTYYNNGEMVGTLNGEKITVTEDTYLRLLRILGLTTLSERSRTSEFTGDVDTKDTYIYKVDYDLGDVVRAVDRYGISGSAIITEVMESDDNKDGYVIEPKFEF